MVSEESVTNHSAGSPWWWDDLDDDERAQNWQGLAWWVDWLVDAYSPWVVLPPCWALHEGIATELKVFWNWHALAIKVESSPADAIRWHQELRTSATAWRELANCKHEPQLVQLEHRIAAPQRKSYCLHCASSGAGQGEPEWLMY